MNCRNLICFLAIIVLFSNCKNNNRDASLSKADSTKYSGKIFNEHIRSTEARSPEEERKGFRLPEGFEITLYASEPDIGKPINLSFDAQGRMWVTQSFEYPFAAAAGQGKDRLTIIEDTDGDGRGDKFMRFNDSLNIPIGVLPVVDGAVVYSIPNLYRLTDENGDGKPEKSKKLVGPFEAKDTHGMINNLAWGFDGWIHACHGFSNRSSVAGADGDSVHFISGNTFRFRPDGSRVEHVTSGRINPFGLTYDEWGYQYSTDCHTSPLYQLIRGGDYTQWGKEEEMGFAPDMKPLENEATALAGITYYSDNHYPENYRKNLYIGDAVSSRVYRNSFSWKGSSPVGKKEDDFVLSEDPWFRPVDVKMGPDGAIYIADFYNSIIGHYEVPLDHPKRDRIRGRIWRITYNGKTNGKQDLSKASVDELVKSFNSPNLAVRLMAANQVADRIGKSSAPRMQQIISNANASTAENVHALWVLQRLGELTDEQIKSSAQKTDPVIRVHTMRTIAEQKDSSAALYPVITATMKDKDPHVRRAAVELMARYPGMNSVETLIAYRKEVPADDSHMIYTTRLMLRNLLRNPTLMNEVAARQWKEEDAAVLSTVLIGVQHPAAATFLFNYIREHDLEERELPKAFRHIVRFIPQQQVAEVIAMAQKKYGNGSKMEYRVFTSLKEGIARKGAKETEDFKNWGRNTVRNIFNKNLKAVKNSDEEIRNEVDFAVDLAGEYKMADVQPKLVQTLKDTSLENYIRTSAAQALMKINSQKNAVIAGEILQSTETDADLKRDIVYALAEYPSEHVSRILASLKNVSPDLQQGIVLALANSESGKNILFEKVRKGEIFPRVLAEPKVEERLMMGISASQMKVYKELTANVEKVDAEKQSVISERIENFNKLEKRPDPLSGQPVFAKHCAPCHNIKGQGGGIGPQLDGVGKWGVAPLIEKILDPNRNISENFRSYTLKLKDGKVMTGLYRRDEGQVIVYADAAGKEFSVSKQDIAQRTASKYTLMPDQFRNTIPVDDFNSLISYLLSQNN